MHIDLDNVEGPAGDYRVQVASEVASEGIDVIGAPAPQVLKLAARQRNSMTVPLTSSGPAPRT